MAGGDCAGPGMLAGIVGVVQAWAGIGVLAPPSSRRRVAVARSTTPVEAIPACFWTCCTACRVAGPKKPRPLSDVGKS